VLRTHAAPPAILVAAYLVDAGAVAEFRQRADELAEQQTRAHVLITGPWPRYSFAGEQQR
jgi:hypothetical protein